MHRKGSAAIVLTRGIACLDAHVRRASTAQGCWTVTAAASARTATAWTPGRQAQTPIQTCGAPRLGRQLRGGPPRRSPQTCWHRRAARAWACRSMEGLTEGSPPGPGPAAAARTAAAAAASAAVRCGAAGAPHQTAWPSARLAAALAEPETAEAAGSGGLHKGRNGTTGALHWTVDGDVHAQAVMLAEPASSG